MSSKEISPGQSMSLFYKRVIKTTLNMKKEVCVFFSWECTTKYLIVIAHILTHDTNYPLK